MGLTVHRVKRLLQDLSHELVAHSLLFVLKHQKAFG